MGSLWRAFELGAAVLPAERPKPTVGPRNGLEVLRFVVSVHAVKDAFGWTGRHALA